MKIIDKYSQNTLINKISVNSAEWRIPVRVEGVGKPTIYNANFNPVKSRWLRFVVILAAFVGILLLFKHFPTILQLLKDVLSRNKT